MRRMGFRLFNRTTRSIALTETGEQLFGIIEPKLGELKREMRAYGHITDSLAISVSPPQNMQRQRFYRLVTPRLFPQYLRTTSGFC